jgi:hypothetical protein
MLQFLPRNVQHILSKLHILLYNLYQYLNLYSCAYTFIHNFPMIWMISITFSKMLSIHIHTHDFILIQVYLSCLLSCIMVPLNLLQSQSEFTACTHAHAHSVSTDVLLTFRVPTMQRFLSAHGPCKFSL